MITSWRWNDAGLAQDEDGLKEAEMALGWSWSQDHMLTLELRWDGAGVKFTS